MRPTSRRGSRPYTSARTRSAIATSSSAATPARSPRPLTVHSTCVAPASTPASVFATPGPRPPLQAVDGAPARRRPGLDARERVRDREPEVIVTVDGEAHPVELGAEA